MDKAAPEVAPKDDYTNHNKQFKTYRSTVGQLKEDNGTKGSLKNFSGGKSAKTINIKNKVKTPYREESQYNDSNPGVGN